MSFVQESDLVNTQQTVRQFMAALDSQIYMYQKALVFAKASTPTLSSPQLKFLESLPTAMVFTCLQLFIQWLKDGMYDFHTLPFTLKTHLSPEDQEALLQIPNKWRAGNKKMVHVCHIHVQEVLRHLKYIVHLPRVFMEVSSGRLYLQALRNFLRSSRL